MRSRLVLAAALIAVAAAAAAAAGCSSRACPEPTMVDPDQPPSAGDVTSVLRTVEQWRQAYEVRSADGLFELYDHGKEVSLVQQGAVIAGWEAVQSDIQARLAKAKGIRMRLTDLRVALLGGTGAVVTASASREVSDEITTVSEAGILTLSLGRDGDRWVIVSEHYSVRRQ